MVTSWSSLPHFLNKLFVKFWQEIFWVFLVFKIFKQLSFEIQLFKCGLIDGGSTQIMSVFVDLCFHFVFCMITRYSYIPLTLYGKQENATFVNME